MSSQTVHFKNIKEKIIECLENANTEVLIAVAWFTDDEIIKVLNNLSLKNVKISIIFYEDKINNKNLFKSLYYRNVELKVSKKLMHNKFCIIDQKVIINGSYNWTYNAAKNDENIQITVNNYELVNSFTNEFYKLRKNCSDVDNHFNYSAEKISTLLSDYELTYKTNFAKQQTPYFYKFTNLEIHPIHQKQYRTVDGIVIIKNKLQEYNFFKLLHFLEKEIPLTEIRKIFNLEMKFPLVYDCIEEYKFNYKILKIEKERGFLKQYLNNSFNLKSSNKLFNTTIIDAKGTIIEKIDNCYRLPSGMYFSNFNIYDEGFNLIIDNSKLRIVDFIDGFGYVQHNYDKNSNELLYGLFDLKGNTIIDYCYKFYNRNVLRSYLYSGFRSFAEKIVESGIFDLATRYENEKFIFPLKFYGIISENCELLIEDLNTLQNLINSKDSTIIFYELPYLLTDNDLLTKRKIVRSFHSYQNLDDFKSHAFKENIFDIKKNKVIYGKIHKKKIENMYFFLSDKNFAYEQLYKSVAENTSHILLICFLDIYDKFQLGFFDRSEKIVLDNLVIRSRNIYKNHIDEYYRQKDKKQKECYIATMIYKDVNHPKVEFLRKFRDEKLASYLFGIFFIKYYYIYSPILVEKIKHYRILNFIIKMFLNLTIKIIK